MPRVHILGKSEPDPLDFNAKLTHTIVVSTQLSTMD